MYRVLAVLIGVGYARKLSRAVEVGGPITFPERTDERRSS
jgi:hypothetical protein